MSNINMPKGVEQVRITATEVATNIELLDINGRVIREQKINENIGEIDENTNLGILKGTTQRPWSNTGGNKPKNKKTFQRRDKLGRFIKRKTRKSSGGWLN